MTAKETVAVIGLGYVGLPLAVAFAKSEMRVIGFDIKEERVNQLKESKDTTLEFSPEELQGVSIEYTTQASKLKEANYIIVAVPTPVDENNIPDLKPVESAAELIGKNVSKGTIVVLESTVYPGVTEEIMAPIIEKISGLHYGQEFKVGYSPERINPGDKEHTIDKIVKVVSGMDQETLDKVAALYSKVTKAGVFRAKNIKTAEAAKVIENIQRDLNIALMNELSIIFDKLGVSTHDVLEASRTKWNFHVYSPGLVGGHCIPVDPYYLTHKAHELGYISKVILAGRELNNFMPKHIVSKTMELLASVGKFPKPCKVLILGLTFKENVPDVRTSKAKDVINEFKKVGIDVVGYDPILSKQTAEKYFGISMQDAFDAIDYDALVIISPHKEIIAQGLGSLIKDMGPSPVVIDVKGAFRKVVPDGVTYFCL